MIRFEKEMECLKQEHACNGKGYIHKQFLFSTDEMDGKAKMCARITLPPGSSIGDHPHQPEAEIANDILGGGFAGVAGCVHIRPHMHGIRREIRHYKTLRIKDFVCTTA